ARCLLTTRPVLGTAERIAVQFRGFPRLVRPGARVLLADGRLELRVLRRSRGDVLCRVVTGGLLNEHQGINLPGLRIPIPALTRADREALSFLARAEADWIALSFVQRASDLESARRILRRSGRRIPLIAKIERPEALRHIGSILRAADGIMVARGDLGVEMPVERIPVVQKELIHQASLAGVPVITATQMLDSMVASPRPTRAETTDVANAIWD